MSLASVQIIKEATVNKHVFFKYVQNNITLGIFT